jgi:hypothetical protein
MKGAEEENRWLTEKFWFVDIGYHRKSPVRSPSGGAACSARPSDVQLLARVPRVARRKLMDAPSGFFDVYLWEG